ncbi:MAG TPA: amino acid permease [Pengzhenrongella sp.]
MAAALPSSGSFSTCAEEGIGRWAGFTLGWVYWFTLIMVLGVELTGASTLIHGWAPAVPQWVVALALIGFFAGVNLLGVRGFGEFEFWFAALKVAVIVVFLVVGALLVFGLLPGTAPVGFTHLLGNGGFAPNGAGQAAAGLLVVGSVAIMVVVLPWNSPALLAGPFVAVLQLAHIPGLALMMEVVVVIALLSAFNANFYGTSRMAFSLAQRGDGPPALLRVSRQDVPVTSVLVSVAFALVSALLNWLLPDQLLGLLLNAVGSSLIVIWIVIVISQLRLRPRLEAQGRLSVRMWGLPVPELAHARSARRAGRPHALRRRRAPAGVRDGRARPPRRRHLCGARARALGSAGRERCEQVDRRAGGVEHDRIALPQNARHGPW